MFTQKDAPGHLSLFTQTMRNHVYRITATILTAAAAVVVLRLVQPANTTAVTVPRKITGTLPLLYTAAFQSPLRSVAGILGDTLWLTTADPSRLVYLTRQQDTGHLLIPLPLSDSLRSLFDAFITKDCVYILGGNSSVGWRWDRHGHTLQPFPIPVQHFTRSLLLDDSLFILRAYQRLEAGWTQRFCRFNAVTGAVSWDPGYTGASSDAGFKTDGVLVRDPHSNQLLYSYYYLNQCVVLDSRLQETASLPTIEKIPDTLEIARLSGQGETVVSNRTPFPDLHGVVAVHNGKVLLQSLAGAPAFDRAFMQQHIVIDVYDLAGRRYSNTLLVPRAWTEPLHQLAIQDDRLVLLYDRHIAVYRLPEGWQE